MLDAVAASDWTGSGNLYQRNFYQMLYSKDGTEIMRMPIGEKFWPDDVRKQYNYVEANKKPSNASAEQFRTFSDGKSNIKDRDPAAKTADDNDPDSAGGR